MRLIALLSWYDEPVAWLSELVASLAAAGVDELVALDGAYGLYPYPRPRSSTDQAYTLLGAASGAGMAITLRQPSAVWAGNEMEKRTALFGLGHQLAEPGEDWFWVMDADEIVTQALGLRASLAATRHDAAEALAWWPDPDDSGELAYKWVRKLFRAQASGITVERNHWTYRAGDGRFLWGEARERVPCERLWHLEVEHRLARRPDVRRERQYSYYTARAAARIEQEPWVGREPEARSEPRQGRAPGLASEPPDPRATRDQSEPSSGESTGAAERAGRGESTVSGERAASSESTGSRERAARGTRASRKGREHR